MKNTVLVVICISLLLSCSKGKKNKNLLPNASGRPGEMIVVIDSVQWSSELGMAIKNTFQTEIQGLPRTEYLFKLNNVSPLKLNNVLKTVKNLLFVVTIDNNSSASKKIKNFFTPNSLKEIENNEDLFIYTAKDKFARGQNIMYLFGKNNSQLIDKIQKHQKQLQDYFNDAENRRLKKGLYAAKENSQFGKIMIDKYQCSMRIPFGYKLVLSEKDFIWFRQINDDNDKNIFISFSNYTSKNNFEKENIIKNRDNICKKYLFEDPEKPDSHLMTETNIPYIPVVSREYNFNNNYSKETKGIWKTKNLSMGGPFMGYTVVDEKLKRAYYIEGFVYSPGKSQRELMREIKIILNTFTFSSKTNKNSKN